MKLQAQTRHEDNDAQQPRDLKPELEPALGQTFLATAGCGLTSTYINSLLIQPTPNEIWSSLLQTSHNADRTDQHPAAKETAIAHPNARCHRTMMQWQQQQQQRQAHAPHTCHRTADISRGWNPQTLSQVICNEPTCPGMGCTFLGCDLLFPSSPPSQSYSHHITHPKSTKARCTSSHHPIPCTTQTQCWYWTKWQMRLRTNPHPCAPPPPCRWGSRDHRLVRHVPIQHDQDAYKHMALALVLAAVQEKVHCGVPPESCTQRLVVVAAAGTWAYSGAVSCLRSCALYWSIWPSLVCSKASYGPSHNQ